MKPLFLLLILPLIGCHNSPHVSTQELKSWSSNIEVRVQMLESNLPLQAIQPPSPQ